MTDVTTMFDLTGRTAVVTGCSRGIGAAMARTLAAFGATIVGASATLAPGGRTQTEIEAAGGTFHPYAVDFGDRASTVAFAESVLTSHPDVEILVNNAGTIYREPAMDHDLDEWDRVIETNLSAPFVLACSFGRAMAAQGGGRIIFTASLLSYQGGITVPGYTASKSGINGLVKALANEWAASNVNVNAIAPGYIATDNTRALQDDPVRSTAVLDRIPAGRWGRPDDLAGATIFLASAASDYVHGTTITVDGGWMGR